MNHINHIIIYNNIIVNLVSLVNFVNFTISVAGPHLVTSTAVLRGMDLGWALLMGSSAPLRNFGGRNVGAFYDIL